LVSPDKQAELLLARNASGKSGPDMALELGDFGMVEQHIGMIKQLVPGLSADKRAWLRTELQSYEKSISQCTFQLNPSSQSQYGKMRSAFSTLKKALVEAGC
jgi:hypothetical protein